MFYNVFRWAWYMQGVSIVYIYQLSDNWDIWLRFQMCDFQNIFVVHILSIHSENVLMSTPQDPIEASIESRKTLLEPLLTWASIH